MSTIDDGPKDRQETWVAVQELFEDWSLSREGRLAILKCFDVVYTSWENAGRMSSDGPWWERALKLIEIHSLLKIGLGGREMSVLRAWLSTTHRYSPFQNESPLEMMLSEESKAISNFDNIIARLRIIKID